MLSTHHILVSSIINYSPYSDARGPLFEGGGGSPFRKDKVLSTYMTSLPCLRWSRFAIYHTQYRGAINLLLSVWVELSNYGSPSTSPAPSMLCSKRLWRVCGSISQVLVPILFLPIRLRRLVMYLVLMFLLSPSCSQSLCWIGP